MPVFISWSGETSRLYAEPIADWVRFIAPGETVFFSPNISGGAIGLIEMITALERATFGILCMTPDNSHAGWLHFEAGAILNNLGGTIAGSNKPPVVPILCHGLELRDLQDPLRILQAKLCDKRGLKDVADALNLSRADHRLDQDVLNRLFDLLWEDLEKALSTIAPVPNHTTGTKADREPSPIETLELHVQQLQGQIDELRYTRDASSPLLPQNDSLAASRQDLTRTLFDLERELAARFSRNQSVVEVHAKSGADLLVNGTLVVETRVLRDGLSSGRRIRETLQQAQAIKRDSHATDVLLAFLGAPLRPDNLSMLDSAGVPAVWSADGKQIFGTTLASARYPFLLDGLIQ